MTKQININDRFKLMESYPDLKKVRVRVSSNDTKKPAEDVFFSLDEALKSGRTFIAKGRNVVVLPNYNEQDKQGNQFFREFRSVDGEDFTEIRFSQV